MLMTVLALAFANVTAPRRLQSLAAPVHAEAEARSSVRSTVIVANGKISIMDGCEESAVKITRSRWPLTCRGIGSTATGSLETSTLDTGLSALACEFLPLAA